MHFVIAGLIAALVGWRIIKKAKEKPPDATFPLVFLSPQQPVFNKLDDIPDGTWHAFTVKMPVHIISTLGLRGAKVYQITWQVTTEKGRENRYGYVLADSVVSER